MTKEKQKGTSFEVLVRDYLKDFWPAAHRPALSGSKDTGDINGLPLPLECKNTKTMNLGGWIKEAEAEAANAGAIFCPIVHKRRGKGFAGDQWVTITLKDLVRLMQALEKANLD